MIRLVILGAPGSGKGTQCKWIKEEYNVPHISTGDILRENVAKETELGIKAKSFMDNGELVPDALIIEMLESRLREEDCKERGFLLDGFPRTIPQAEALDRFLDSEGIALDRVLNIEVADEEVIQRIVNRRTCSNSDCKEIYNLRDKAPAVDGICDKCGSTLFQRDDDNELTVSSRLKAYHLQTEPLIDYYKESGKVATVIGQEKLEDTISLVKAELNK